MADSVGTIVWFEIPADDVERAKQFYTGLFGWAYEPFEGYDPNYWMIQFEQETALGGGIVPRNDVSTPGRGPVVYVHVPDLEKAVAEAERLGGALQQGRTLITETAGSFALVTDTEGNLVGLWSD